MNCLEDDILQMLHNKEHCSHHDLKNNPIKEEEEYSSDEEDTSSLFDLNSLSHKLSRKQKYDDLRMVASHESSTPPNSLTSSNKKNEAIHININLPNSGDNLGKKLILKIDDDEICIINKTTKYSKYQINIGYEDHATSPIPKNIIRQSSMFKNKKSTALGPESSDEELFTLISNPGSQSYDPKLTPTKLAKTINKFQSPEKKSVKAAPPNCSIPSLPFTD